MAKVCKNLSLFLAPRNTKHHSMIAYAFSKSFTKLPGVQFRFGVEVERRQGLAEDSHTRR